MTDNSSNPNIEWKKTGFGTTEKLSLKINAREAVKYNAKNKNAIQTNNPLTPADLPAGLKKIRKKIKDVFDEDDEDEEEFIATAPLQSLQESNSLYNALNEEEKKILRQQETLQNMKMQQDAGKLEALTLAAHALQEQGVEGLSRQTVAKVMQDAAPMNKSLENMVKKDLVKGLKLKDENLAEGRYIQILRGINNIKRAGGIKAVEGLSLREVERASDEKQVAKVLLEKTGRKEPKKKKRQLEKQIDKKLQKSGKKQQIQVSRKNLSFHTLEEKSRQERGK